MMLKVTLPLFPILPPAPVFAILILLLAFQEHFLLALKNEKRLNKQKIQIVFGNLSSPLQKGLSHLAAQKRRLLPRSCVLFSLPT